MRRNSCWEERFLIWNLTFEGGFNSNLNLLSKQIGRYLRRIKASGQTELYEQNWERLTHLGENVKYTVISWEETIPFDPGCEVISLKNEYHLLDEKCWLQIRQFVSYLLLPSHPFVRHVIEQRSSVKGLNGGT